LSEVHLEAEALVIGGVAEDEDGLPSLLSRLFQPRLDQRAANPASLIFRGHGHGSQPERAKRCCHAGEHDVSGDDFADDCNKRDDGIPVGPEPIDEARFVNLPESPLDDDRHRRLIFSLFGPDDHADHHRNAGGGPQQVAGKERRVPPLPGAHSQARASALVSGMDSVDPMYSIAGMLVSLADEAVEPLLVTFDALVDTARTPRRTEAAALLREKAAECGDPARSARLRIAADALDAGRPCALTPEGLTWLEAAKEAAKTSPEEWRARARDASRERPDDLPAIAPPDRDFPPVILDEPRYRLPRLKVRHFFPGLVVRLRRSVIDTEGHEAPAGQRLRLLRMDVRGKEGEAVYHLHFEERSLRLDGVPQDDRSIIGNGGNGWFQPVPERDALTDLWQLVDGRLAAAESALEDQDDPDQLDGDMLLAVRTDLDLCGNWLQSDGTRRRPVLDCAPVAVEYFGKTSDMAAWVTLLFAAIPHCPSEGWE